MNIRRLKSDPAYYSREEGTARDLAQPYEGYNAASQFEMEIGQDKIYSVSILAAVALASVAAPGFDTMQDGRNMVLALAFPLAAAGLAWALVHEGFISRGFIVPIASAGFNGVRLIAIACSIFWLRLLFHENLFMETSPTVVGTSLGLAVGLGLLTFLVGLFPAVCAYINGLIGLAFGGFLAWFLAPAGDLQGIGAVEGFVTTGLGTLIVICLWWRAWRLDFTMHPMALLSRLAAIVIVLSFSRESTISWRTFLGGLAAFLIVNVLYESVWWSGLDVGQKIKALFVISEPYEALLQRRFWPAPLIVGLLHLLGIAYAPHSVSDRIEWQMGAAAAEFVLLVIAAMRFVGV